MIDYHSLNQKKGVEMAFRDIGKLKFPAKLDNKEVYIFVDTDFKRKNEPIFVLAALSNSRYIRGLYELNHKTIEEQIVAVSRIIRNNYEKNSGKLELWGEIKRYHYHYSSDLPAIVFDIDGTVIGKSSFTESHAVLSIGCKDISPLLYASR